MAHLTELSHITKISKTLTLQQMVSIKSLGMGSDIPVSMP
jgi:hypothetical protein